MATIFFKKYLIFVGILLIFYPVSVLGETCTTIVAGGRLSDEIWTKEGAPYCIDGDIQINSLEIKPGVKVAFLGDYSFEILGILKATGTEDEQIIFTAADTNEIGWQGIYFNQCFPATEFSYCKVEKSHNSGIEIYNASPKIIHCEISDNSAKYGAGIKISGANPVTLSDCVIRDNSFWGAHPRGGGVYTSAKLIMNRCEVINNKIADRHDGNCWSGSASTLGGGIYSTAELVLNDVLVMGNQASSNGGTENSRGGGVYVTGPFTCNKSVIANNIADAGGCNLGGGARGYGGGVYIGSTVSMMNSIIANNSTRTSGGGIYAVSGAQGTIQNCTIVFSNYPGGITAYSGIHVLNSIIYFNSSYQISGNFEITYSDVEGCIDGIGNICAHPLLIANTEDPSTYMIPETSPCVDAGNPDAQYNDVCFPPSRGTERNDIGAHGGAGICPDIPILLKASAGPDKIICNTICDKVVLDGRKSYARNSEIVSYDWVLDHEDDLCDKSSSGQTPTIANLCSGNYYVMLTVTNDKDQTATDDMKLIVLETCNPCSIMQGDFDSDGDVDGDDLRIFSGHYGINDILIPH
ncbi:MAG: hypothetical protein B1H11_08190 [Desulfobacteraceae bacterium 4484_190.1]|nr:MAG: hypothetical protein B1H11_08190 [Desulfobacteraceae bacterium 4484_190.1]